MNLQSANVLVRFKNPAFAALALVAAVTLLGAPVPASAQGLDRFETNCLQAVAQITRRAATTVIRARSLCVLGKSTGRTPLAADCLADSPNLGGAGTGSDTTDRRLDKILDARTRAGARLTKRCDNKSATRDVDPVEVLPAAGLFAGAADWTAVGTIAVDLGKTAGDAAATYFSPTPTAIPQDAGERECLKQLHRQARVTTLALLQWRANCFLLQETFPTETFTCNATIAPQGQFNTTGDAKTDKRLEIPMEKLIAGIRRDCDIDHGRIGFDTLVPDQSGGDFSGRITTDDVVHAMNDRITDAVMDATHELFDLVEYCGNGAVEGSESCDDDGAIGGCSRDCSASSCGNGAIDDVTEECDDGNDADGDGCSASCLVELCGNGEINLGWDEICDDGGESVTCDNDCTPQACGDAELNVTAGEECDNGGANANAPDACRLGPPSGEPGVGGACQLPACLDGITDTGEDCDDGGLGNAGETVTCDLNCTTATCGDGDLNPTRGETCDDGNASDADDCPSSDASGDTTGGGWCITATCGDGFTCSDAFLCDTAPGGLPEECDDTGESATCDTDCTVAECGDGTLNSQNTTAPATVAGELCDDGDLINGDGCDGNCTPTGCGNGIQTAGEACDDGNLTNGDGCDDAAANPSNSCSPTGCGNGLVTAGEACDGDSAGNGGETATCDADCTAAACQDGTLNVSAGEECDAGAESAGCDTDCTLAICGDNTLNTTAGETCDDGGESAACDTDCTASACQDAVLNETAGEQCDAGAESAGCDTDCTFAICGDGTTNTTAGETCDDGGESATCDTNCTAAACGDGTLNTTAGEQCDDSNVIPGDGCDASCQVE